MVGIRTVLSAITVIAAPSLGPASVSALDAASRDGVFHVTVAGRILDFVDPGTGTISDRWELDRPATSVALNDWGGIVYVGHADGTVQALETGAVKRRWRTTPFDASVVGLSVWNGDVMAVDADGSAVFLDAASGVENPDSPGDLPLPSASPPIAAQLFTEVARIGFEDGRVLEYDRPSRRLNAIPVPPALSVEEAVASVPDVARTMGIVPATARTATTCAKDVGGVERCRTVVVPSSYGTVYRQIVETDTSRELENGRFPWPPPPYTDAHVVSGDRLTASGMRTFEDVARRVGSALAGGNYTAPRHYAIDDGFVIVTQVEEIDENGVPITPERERWWNGEAPRPDPFTFNLSAFFDAISNAPVGRYRILAFALNAGECPSPPCERPREIDAASALTLASGGGLTLPGTIGATPIDDTRHHLSVLVYSFEKPNKTLPARITRDLSASTHLTAANVMAGLP